MDASIQPHNLMFFYRLNTHTQTQLVLPILAKKYFSIEFQA